MNISTIPVEQRLAISDYFKNRRLAYQAAAFNHLGNRCSLCESTNCLRVRFVEQTNETAGGLQKGLVTLYVKICNEPDFRSEVRLLCRACRMIVQSASRAMDAAGAPAVPADKESL